MSMQAVKRRFCCIRYCPNFRGTTDSSVFFFRAPIGNPELRTKWYNRLTSNAGVQINQNFNMLCSLHFDPNDMKLMKGNTDTSQSKYGLRNGALPLPIVLPQDSVLAVTQPRGCGACAEFALKLQAANVKIATLQEKLNEMKAKNSQLMRNLYLTTNNVIEDDETSTFDKCNICWKRLERSALDTHICLELEFIKCSYCPKKFYNTQSLVDHLDDHADGKKTMYKCHVCPNTYPMIILLDCHKVSHVRTVEPSAPNNVSDDSDDIFEQIISIDDDDEDSIPMKTEITDSIEEEELPVQIVQPTLSIPASTHSKSTEIANKFFKCGRCGDSFERAQELAGHMKMSCGSNTVLSSKEESIAPLTLKSANSCHKCGMTFHTPKRLSRHIQLDLCIKMFECYICRKSLNSMREMRHHLKEHKQIWEKCTICKVELECNELDLHLCGNKKTIQCDYCKKKFIATAKLLDHLEKDHENKKLYRCEKCSRFYPMQFLKDACQASHVDKPRLYICETCSKSFLTKHHLMSHQKSHTKIEKPYLCDLCGRGFTTEQNLNYHKKSNIHQKPSLQCPDCPKKFAAPKHLRRHSHIHRNNKFVCEICNLELVSLIGYKKHMHRHRRTDADRHFACKLCPMKFFESYALRSHQAVHTGEKQFQCRFCDQAYKYKGDLNKHLKLHLGNKIHECPQCPKRFQYPRELQRHSFEHYKEEKHDNSGN